MKKRFLSFLLSLLMLTASAGVAYAKDYQMNENGTYTIELSEKSPGKEYTIVVVAGDYTNKNMPEIDIENIIYIDQVTANENGIISFTAFIPLTDSVGTIYIGGGEDVHDEGILMTESGFGYVAGRLISYSGNANTVTLPESITSVDADAFKTPVNIIIRYGDVEFATKSISENTKLFLSPLAAKAREYAVENNFSYAVLGDYNGNGEIDKADYMAYISGIAYGNTITGEDQLLLDLDMNESVDLRDASILLRFLGGMINDYYEAFTEDDLAFPTDDTAK